jgi:hypothetical protein
MFGLRRSGVRWGERKEKRNVANRGGERWRRTVVGIETSLMIRSPVTKLQLPYSTVPRVLISFYPYRTSNARIVVSTNPKHVKHA